MKSTQLYQILALCFIIGNFPLLKATNPINYYDNIDGKLKAANYDTLNLEFKPHVTATLGLSKDPIKVIANINLDEEQVSTIMTTIIQQLPEIAEESAADIKESFQTIIGSFINLENAIRYGYPIAFWAALSLSGIYGSRVLWKVIEKKYIDPKPTIVLPGSKYGYWDRIKRQRAGSTSPAMIFDQQIKERLIEIQEKTKNICEHIRQGKAATYDNLLLYGQPGTGKTLFAQILADYTDMDFLPVTAASLLQSGVEGIKYFNELLDMANRSKYGLILFVDEADALFIDRDTLNPSSDHYKVLNHILALTGSGSSKFMLIAATNHAYVMDDAMGRRFQDRVLMPLPDDITRKELITLYSDTVLYNIKNNSSHFIAAARSLLTPQTINDIVQKTAGLSHAEIKDMIHAMNKKALATRTGIITTMHIDSALNQAIEKMLALQADKKKREQRFEESKATTTSA
jgi:AAA+ superfamily predicted ATPase